MKHWLLLLLAAALCVGCAQPSPANNNRASDFDLIGRLANPGLREASGLARSSDPDRLWVINDGGAAPQLHAIDLRGEDLGSVRVTNARNTDWEDLASFEHADKLWLVIADIGDNNARRDSCVLYVVAEPSSRDIRAGVVTPARRIEFRYPDGPRDAESIAIDVANQQILILTKRDIPALLYSLPLFPPANATVIAAKLGVADGIPQPGTYDIERAVPDQNWHWQPNAMDIASDGQSAAILTYRATYFFSRRANDDWVTTFQQRPRRFEIGPYAEAEAVVISHSGRYLYVTTENQNAPLLRRTVQ